MDFTKALTRKEWEVLSSSDLEGYLFLKESVKRLKDKEPLITSFFELGRKEMREVLSDEFHFLEITNREFTKEEHKRYKKLKEVLDIK